MLIIVANPCNLSTGVRVIRGKLPKLDTTRNTYIFNLIREY